MPDSYAEEIAEGVLDLLLESDLFSVFINEDGSCNIIWSAATAEQMSARIQEVLDDEE